MKKVYRVGVEKSSTTEVAISKSAAFETAKHRAMKEQKTVLVYESIGGFAPTAPPVAEIEFDEEPKPVYPAMPKCARGGVANGDEIMEGLASGELVADNDVPF